MNSIFRKQATKRLIPDDLLKKTIGGGSQTIAAEFWEAPSGGINYTLLANAGSFVLSGQNATPAVFLTADVGSFAETGENATPEVSMPASTGSFAETGEPSIPAVSLLSDYGAFSETGKQAIPAAEMLVAQGSFAEGGQTASLDLVMVPAPPEPVVVPPPPVSVIVPDPVVEISFHKILPSLPPHVLPEVPAQHGVPSLSFEVPWYERKRKKIELPTGGSVFIMYPGFAGFEVTRHKEAIIPASDYDLLASGGSFFSLSFPSSFSAKRRRICKGGKFYTKLTKAGFGVTRRKKPPLDDEEEFVAPRAKVSRPRHAHVLEEDDDEEALVMMIWGMK